MKSSEAITRLHTDVIHIEKSKIDTQTIELKQMFRNSQGLPLI